MKREVVILIIGIIALALLYYFLTKKSTPTTVVNNQGLIPSATTAINKLGNAINVTSQDIKSVSDALIALFGKKDTQTYAGTGTESTDNTYYA
jgi:hypothetical protein